jgi:D-3-phosphoglycerate dehydrogenase
MSWRVSFVDVVHPVLQQRLEAAGFLCVDHTQLTKEQLVPALEHVHGIVIRSRFTMNAGILDHAPHLRFIARSGAGMENIDVPYCEARHIALFNAPEGNRNAVAEHALGMLLGLMNNLGPADREVRSGQWNREENRGWELDGKTVGIIGFGNNGSAFARKLRGFDVRVLAYDKYLSGFGDQHVTECSLQQLMHEADVVSFHVPQTPETIGMLNHDFIRNMEKPFWVLNLSRGRVVDTAALVHGLETGKVRGAGLDVLEYESTSFENWLNPETAPGPLKYLLKSNQVMLSPHVGGWTHESYFQLSNVLADKVLAWFHGL